MNKIGFSNRFIVYVKISRKVNGKEEIINY